MLGSMNAKSIRQHRLERDLTQIELAKRAGIHPVSMSKIESARMKPSLEVAKKIASALGVGVDDLIFEAAR